MRRISYLIPALVVIVLALSSVLLLMKEIKRWFCNLVG